MTLLSQIVARLRAYFADYQWNALVGYVGVLIVAVSHSPELIAMMPGPLHRLLSVVAVVTANDEVMAALLGLFGFLAANGKPLVKRG